MSVGSPGRVIVGIVVVVLVVAVVAQAVKCLYSKAWSHRHAAVVLITRRVMECVGGGDGGGGEGSEDENDIVLRNIPSVKPSGESDVLKLAPGSAKVFLQLSSVLEMGLWDSVATVRDGVCLSPRAACVAAVVYYHSVVVHQVFLASVELLMAVTQNYLPTVPGKQLIVRAGLQPAVRAVVARLGAELVVVVPVWVFWLIVHKHCGLLGVSGDTKVRVREACEMTLTSLSSLSTITPTMVFEALIDDISGTATSGQGVSTSDAGGSTGSTCGLSPSAIIGRLRVLM